MSLLLIHTSCDDENRARDLAQTLIAQRLAACVHLGARGTSFYTWQGRSETTPEYPLTIKTTTARQAEVIAFLRQHHPYQVPEILCQIIDHADADYAAWVKEQTAANIA
ncbi:MAG: divalent-cation tolerance protein CutA [Neisseria sp.]|nr:divalent-cation tolerance protein CutA [Neisseria sp.]